MNRKQILEEAWALLQQPNAWTRLTNARNGKLSPVGARDDSAVCFCSVGAVLRVAGEVGGLEAYEHLNKTSFSEAAYGIVALNDRVTSVQELAPIWQKAIDTA